MNSCVSPSSRSDASASTTKGKRRSRLLLLLTVALVWPAMGSSDSHGSRFFAERVVVRLVENGCPMCHAVNYVEPTFSYEAYRPLLAMGRSAQDNYLITKITTRDPDGMPVHVGGVRCATVAHEPCATLQEWWRTEFGGIRNGE